MISHERRRELYRLNPNRLEIARKKRWKQLGVPLPTRPRPEVCEVCGRAPITKGLAADHCHTSGLFRGWLCIKCNFALGAVSDSVLTLKNLISYLERSCQQH